MVEPYPAGRVLAHHRGGSDGALGSQLGGADGALYGLAPLWHTPDLNFR